MKYLNMLFICMKRALKHPSIALLLIAIPLTAFIYTSISADNKGAFVGIYDKGNADDIIEDIKKADNRLTFTVYDSEEKMKGDVETQKLECAFIFPENIEEMSVEKIILGEGQTSVLSELTMETVFSAILKNEGGKIAYKFAEENNIDLNKEKYFENYNNYLNNIKSAVKFEEFSSAPNENIAHSNILDCIIAIITVCGGLSGAIFVISDRKKGIVFTSGFNIAAVMILFLTAEIISFIILRQVPDILRLCLLNLGIWGICRIICMFSNDERLIRLAMPVLTAASVIFDIVDISAFVPSLGAVNYILITHYYVYEEITFFAAVSIILFCMGIFSGKT